MPVFQYSNPSVILWGRGSIDRLSDELKRLGSRWPAVVTTRSLVNSTSRLKLANRSPATAVIGQHAPMSEVETAILKVDEADADGVISFGGGSPIDAAKMLALRLGEKRQTLRGTLPHIAIPTTLSVAELAAGAGYTDASGTKSGMRDPRLLPDVVIYDPELTLETPIELWLSSGIRALDHAVEGFLADGEHPFNDVMALEAIRRLFRVLPATKADPQNVGCRSDCQLAAWFSFTLPGASASGLSHVMGKQIGARHRIPHGVTSCLLLPHVVRYLGRHRPERIGELGVTADDIAGLIHQLGLPQHIAHYGIGEPELRQAASELAGKYPEADLLSIYLSAL
jgi:maleylacetate reductase